MYDEVRGKVSYQGTGQDGCAQTATGRTFPIGPASARDKPPPDPLFPTIQDLQDAVGTNDLRCRILWETINTAGGLP
jgi:hypothetical protein